MREVFDDTSFIVALVNERDASHTKAIDLSLAYQSCRHVITDAIILEIGNALARSFKPEAVAIIRDFLDSDDVEVVRMTPELFDKAFSLYESVADKEWGLVDCLSFVAMRERGITHALTSDQHFVQAGFQALMRT